MAILAKAVMAFDDLLTTGFCLEWSSGIGGGDLNFSKQLKSVEGSKGDEMVSLINGFDWGVWLSRSVNWWGVWDWDSDKEEKYFLRE